MFCTRACRERYAAGLGRQLLGESSTASNQDKGLAPPVSESLRSHAKAETRTLSERVQASTRSPAQDPTGSHPKAAIGRWSLTPCCLGGACSARSVRSPWMGFHHGFASGCTYRVGLYRRTRPPQGWLGWLLAPIGCCLSASAALTSLFAGTSATWASLGTSLGLCTLMARTVWDGHNAQASSTHARQRVVTGIRTWLPPAALLVAAVVALSPALRGTDPLLGLMNAAAFLLAAPLLSLIRVDTATRREALESARDRDIIFDGASAP